MRKRVLAGCPILSQPPPGWKGVAQAEGALMEDEKDPLRELKLREQAEEDIFFARRDRELIQRLRDAHDHALREHIRELTRMRCPHCGARLQRVEHHGVTVEECPSRHGMWLTQAELETLAKREHDSWIGRYFYRPKPVV